MKVKVTVDFKEGYLPPRCRKMRYRNAAKETVLNIRETTEEDAPIAFVVHYYDKDIIYRFYKGKLYTLTKWNDVCCGKEGLLPPEELWKYLRGRYDYWNCDFETNRKEYMKAAREYLIIDGKVYRVSGEPRYVIITFGLGHNHGGTGMFVEEFYNPNISNKNYFSALDGEAAVAYANSVAAGRGDTNDVGKFKAGIDVLMPEVVKVKPRSQHGKGDKFMNDLEDIINNSGSAFEAGLLCMAFTSAEVNK